ncbi:MAG TPA: hypothetical protein VL651_03120 [Bacteroidia bacterium]|jgi:hypothetical protein|nr:hypothetical protein [Bacteroidia bacterium]
MKLLRAITIILLLFNGIGALYGGWKLITDPSGTSLGLSLDFLEHSPFRNYLFPGITLFCLNGLLSLFICYSVIAKKKYYPFLVLMQGLLLTGWIVIQLLMLQFVFFLHFVMGGTGLVLILLGIGLFIERKRSAANSSKTILYPKAHEKLST